MQVYSLFPTPVIKFSNVIGEKERLSIFSQIKTFSTPSYPAIQGDGGSSFVTNSKVLKDFGLEMTMLKKISEYCKTVGISPVKITNSWYSIQQQGSKLLQHNHPGSILSAVLYINVDEHSSPLIFNTPDEVKGYTWWQCMSVTDYNVGYSSFTPENGDLFVFPGWLKHGSDNSLNNTKDRTIISFNTEFYPD
tara:strand:- start:734 stop:1309 length:576 start_codon:yes stop_codon:yes gene_type:complete